jgi:hypothetical protein
MENDNKSIDKMNNRELIDILWQGLNKSNLKGVFSINESYLLRVVHDKLLEKITNIPGQSE